MFEDELVDTLEYLAEQPDVITGHVLEFGEPLLEILPAPFLSHLHLPRGHCSHAKTDLMSLRSDLVMWFGIGIYLFKH